MAQDNTSAVKTLGAALGMALELDEDSRCELVLDGEIELSLSGDPDGTSLQLCGLLYDLPSSPSAGELGGLLAVNFEAESPEEGFIALDDETGEVLLLRWVDVMALEPESLVNAFLQFLSRLLQARVDLPSAMGRPAPHADGPWAAAALA